MTEQAFAIEECVSCGVRFYIPSSLQAQRKKDRDWIYCPNGHMQHYKKSTADILKEELDQTKASLEQHQGEGPGPPRLQLLSSSRISILMQRQK